MASNNDHDIPIPPASFVGYGGQYGSIPTAPVVYPETTTQPLRSAAAAPAGMDGMDPVVVQCLLDQGYTKGLVVALIRNTQAFSNRIWVVDNSGSMSTNDGERLVDLSSSSSSSRGGSLFRRRSSNTNNTTASSRQLRVASCTRWRELQDTVEYHAQLASLLRAPTEFRLLNDPGRLAGPQYFSVGGGCSDSTTTLSYSSLQQQQDFIDQQLAVTLSTLHNTEPGGVTPLLKHIHEIQQQIRQSTPLLRQSGSKVVVVLATDGIPTDEYGYTGDALKRQFTAALREFEVLPVWLVIRLCTNDDAVVEYWNNLDQQVELSHDVLDDYANEAKEIQSQNPWLTYGLPLHRMREMGFYHRVFDLLDERALSLEEVLQFLTLLLGPEIIRDLQPDPQLQWNAFCDALQIILQKEAKQWNPINKRMEPWINVKKLRRQYGGCAVIISDLLWWSIAFLVVAIGCKLYVSL